MQILTTTVLKSAFIIILHKHHIYIGTPYNIHFKMKKSYLSMRHLLSASSNNFEFRNYIAIVIFVNTEVIIILEKFGKYVDL